MPPEVPFRIAVVAVMVLTLMITLYHRLRAASSGEKISRKDEGFLFAIVIRLSGVCLMVATIAYVFFPSSVHGHRFLVQSGFAGWVSSAEFSAQP